MPGIAAGSANIFVATPTTGEVACVSLKANLKPSHGLSQLPSISADGTVVAFASEATDLVAGDANGVFDILAAGGAATDLVLTVEPSPPTGGSVAPAAPVTVAPWSATEIAATAAEGHDFIGWTVAVGGATIGNADTPTTTVMLGANSTVVANFAPRQYAVNFALAPSPAHASLSGTATQSVAHGTDADPVTAIAPEGYRFVKWTDAEKDFSTDNPVTVSAVTAPHSLVANFAPEHLVFHQVTFRVTGDGEILGEAVQVVPHGGDCGEVIATPGDGQQLVKWTLDGADHSQAAALHVTGVTADLAFVANFAPDDETYHAVLFAAVDGGEIAGAAFQVVRDGDLCEPVTALPHEGSQFVKWTCGVATVAITPTIAFGPVTAAATVLANFADAAETWHTVTLLVDGPGTLDGDTVQVVRHGEDATPVTPLADESCIFLGWTGDFSGKVAPLTLVRVRRSLTVTARFADPALLEPVARGSRLGIHADDVDLAVFLRKPRAYGLHYLPHGPALQTKQKKATLKIVGKLPAEGADALAAVWPKTVRLYDARAFKRAQRENVTAAEWLGFADTQPILGADLWVASPETDPRDRFLRTVIVMPPEITTVTVDGDTLVLDGAWFGTATPKAWLEAIAWDGQLRHVKLKILPPNDEGIRDIRGLPAFMNAEDGASRAVVVLPDAYPRDVVAGDVIAIVLDNGVGLATHPLDLVGD